MYHQEDLIRRDTSTLFIDFTADQLIDMLSYYSKKYPNKCRRNLRMSDVAGHEMSQSSISTSPQSN